MALLGLILVAAAVVAGVEIAVSNTQLFDVEAFGYVSDASPAALLIAGVVLTLAALLGFAMIAAGMRMMRRRRVERRSVAADERDVDSTTSELADENTRLRQELAEERRRQLTMGGVAVPPGAGQPPYGDQVTDAVRVDTNTDRLRHEPYPGEPVVTETPAYDETRRSMR